MKIKLNENIREKFAELCHIQWTGWMRYLFSKCIVDTDSAMIPKEYYERWTRQIRTNYCDLQEYEKNSDRIEADRIIELLKANSFSENISIKDIDDQITSKRKPGRLVLGEGYIGFSQYHQSLSLMKDDFSTITLTTHGISPSSRRKIRLIAEVLE